MRITRATSRVTSCTIRSVTYTSLWRTSKGAGKAPVGSGEAGGGAYGRTGAIAGASQTYGLPADRPLGREAPCCSRRELFLASFSIFGMFQYCLQDPEYWSHSYR